jgi:hypothetical protein
MVGIVKAVYKSKSFIEGHTFEANKQTRVVKDQYKISIDEISADGTINQQVITAYAENVNLVNKLEKLDLYQQVYFVVDILYFRGQLNKIVVLDLIDSESEQKVIRDILNAVIN